MKEEYLWNKTGSDPEIERLESALKEFCYQEDESPALPAKMFFLKKEKSRFSFKLAFAVMAFAALAVIFAGVQFQLPDDTIETAVTPSEMIEPPVVEVVSTESSFEKLSVTDDTVRSGGCVGCLPRSARSRFAVRAGQRDARRTVARTTVLPFPASFQKVSQKSNQSVTAIKNQDDWNVKDSRAKNPAVKLTKEESYAYNQLMLALSITSSKLRLVTDKIEGVEDQNAVPIN